MYGVILQIK